MINLCDVIINDTGIGWLISMYASFCHHHPSLSNPRALFVMQHLSGLEVCMCVSVYVCVCSNQTAHLLNYNYTGECWNQPSYFKAHQRGSSVGLWSYFSALSGTQFRVKWPYLMCHSFIKQQINVNKSVFDPFSPSWFMPRFLICLLCFVCVCHSLEIGPSFTFECLLMCVFTRQEQHASADEARKAVKSNDESISCSLLN